MDAPAFNGEPGAMPYDDEHEPREVRESVPVCDRHRQVKELRFEGLRREWVCLGCQREQAQRQSA